jgi:hypothetical protein
MFKKYLTFVLTILVINLFLSGVAFAGSKEEKLAKFAEKVKANVTKLGTGKDAVIQVKLRDNTKLKGYVTEINENSFIVMNEKTGTSTEVPYKNAKQVKGNNFSTGVTIAIVAGIILVIAAIVGATSPD